MNSHSKQPKEMSPFVIDKDLVGQYKKRFDESRIRVFDKYEILGFISSGTYGRVYKAVLKNKNDKTVFAIKKFKPEKEGEAAKHSGISQSACREIGVNLFLICF
ncbi:cyclin-dependent protein kinase [Entomophthora muscae]|uniref:Cyclin-dependent protein kinase n=1 Tax=Entomophthora muscae TaxID=34485 RepID=A0ACC2UKC4_9FUNG|nr:cyclin-dependent protein kinase [Entomophthora muscae]